jgi:hypothetical protein
MNVKPPASNFVENLIVNFVDPIRRVAGNSRRSLRLSLRRGIHAALCILSLGIASAPAEIVIQSTVPKTNETGIIVPPPSSGEVGRADVLEFLNGDVLHGTFLSIDANRGARWQHPAIKQPLEIALSSVGRIKLERPKTTNGPAQNCTVRLLNKDEITGTLVLLDGEKLQLETWYGGTLNIPRKSIERVVPGQGKSLSLYEGPTGLEGWNMPKNNPAGRRPPGVGPWRYSNGAFFSTGAGPIGREIVTPAMVNIEFDLAWRGYLQLAVSMFSDSLETYGGNAYLLQMHQGSVYLQRISRTGDSSGFGTREVPNFSRKNEAHISVRVNKAQKTLSLLVDGALVNQWTDRGEFPPGTNLVFHQQGQGLTRISNIRVTAWDGKFETETAGAKGKEDLVRMLNNDKLSGTLKAIQNGTMQFQTGFATVEVPLERVGDIELASGPSEPIPPLSTDARVVFADRGSLTFRIDRWDDQQIIGTSPNFGKLRLNPLAFSSVQFNLDKKRAETETFDSGAGPDGLIIDFE